METDRRPDPDAMLERLQEEERKAQRGKLKIFFGASAGVGKTFAMLLAARQATAQGVDVMAGIVETHGRAETMALLEGLEVLPLKEVEYRGRTLKEFDLDGALQRHPALILVDELAHSNVPGSRHPKRWRDVEELLAAGSDVYTTIMHCIRIVDEDGEDYVYPEKLFMPMEISESVSRALHKQVA